jgi:5'-nucleotidase
VRRGLRRLAAVALALALAGCARTPGPERAGRSDVRRVTIVAVSDWHGHVEPVVVTVGGVPRPVGGAAALKAYFDRERRRNPGGTMVVTGGDAFGATPPISSFLDDVPAVEAQNAMGFDLDTLGNHNFDRGLPHLAKLMGLARFSYVAANIVTPDGRSIAPPTRIVTLDGVRVGVIGIGNPDTPEVVAPGRTGEYAFLPPGPVVEAHAEALRRDRADVVVVLAHVGATGVDAHGRPLGRLGALARAVRGVDVLIGDHTDVTVNAVVDDVLVVETRSRGVQYAVIDVDVDLAGGGVLRKAATLHTPFADEIAPDPAVAAMVDGWRAQVAPLFDRKVGEAGATLERSRQGESALGNLVADALRTAYGTELAFVNSGGLRDTLPSAYRPAARSLRRPLAGYAAGPPWDLVHGDLLAVFPFGNVAVTFRITGRTLWTALENSVAEGLVEGGRFENEAGRFLQISGFTYRFDARRPRGHRVRDVRRADGGPLAADGREYSAATIDFVYHGGDGYTMLDNGTATSREPLTEVVAGAIARQGTVGAPVEGRIGQAEQGRTP